MLKNIKIKNVFLLLCLLNISSAYATTLPVAVTAAGELNFSSTTRTFENLFFQDTQQGHTSFVYSNIDPTLKTVSGRFMLTMLVGTSANFELCSYQGCYCTFSATANNARDVKISLIKVNSSSPLACSVSGSPNNNTAIISIKGE